MGEISPEEIEFLTAVREGNLSGAKRCLDAGVDVNVRDALGLAALSYAVTLEDDGACWRMTVLAGG